MVYQKQGFIGYGIVCIADVNIKAQINIKTMVEKELRYVMNGNT